MLRPPTFCYHGRMKTGQEAPPRAQTRTQPATVEYVHLPLGEDVLAFAGYYTPEEEVRLPFQGREVLYVTGHVAVESACHGGTCEPQNYWYGSVQGYVVRWQHDRNDAGLPVSEVEPIRDRDTRRELEEIISSRDAVSRIDFR